jgi:hypothetical protein
MSLAIDKKKKTSLDTLALASMGGPSDASVLRDTVRTVLVMVSACILFVGLLSTVAVVVARRVVGEDSGSASSPATAPAGGPSTSQPGHAKSAHPI